MRLFSVSRSLIYMLAASATPALTALRSMAAGMTNASCRPNALIRLRSSCMRLSPSLRSRN